MHRYFFIYVCIRSALNYVHTGHVDCIDMCIFTINTCKNIEQQVYMGIHFMCLHGCMCIRAFIYECEYTHTIRSVVTYVYACAHLYLHMYTQ
jgi:hypothetical protein